MDPVIRMLTPIRAFFRGRRLRSFKANYQNCRTILDVGGEPDLWSIIGRSEGVTLVNIRVPPDTRGLNFVEGSGCDLPFASQSFDLAFSNSAIEHVGSEENQFKFAAEMLRVGRKIYCQTPCRLFPVDPHLGAFFLHWLPGSWLTPGFLRYFTLYGLIWKRGYEYDVTWISKKKLKQMFPGCQLRTERFLLMPKSFVITN
jgi:hypothetical protein